MRKIGLNAAQLKLIAIVAMVMDHIAPLLVYDTMPLWLIWVVMGMNTIGRLTMPIMCYFIAEGFYHTHDIKKYLMRMAVFAVISQLPFYFYSISEMPVDFFEFIKGNILRMNVICTLFMGLIALCIAKSDRINVILKVILCAGCVLMTRYSDWRLFGVMWVLAFGILRGSFWKQSVAFVLIAFIRVARMDDLYSQIIQFAVVFALPLLYLYNGEKGKQSKYGFYIFYPVHLIVIAMIKIFI